MQSAAIDQALAQQEFLLAFLRLNDDEPLRELVAACRDAWSREPAPPYRDPEIPPGDETPAAALVCSTAEKWLWSWLPESFTVPRWLQIWAERAAAQSFEQFSAAGAGHRQPDVTISAIWKLLLPLHRANPRRWRGELEDELPPDPNEESEQKFVDRMRRAYQRRKAALSDAGLLVRNSATRRHAEWYVRVAIAGEREADIVRQAYAIDPNATLDLSTVKKALAAFATLAELPPIDRQKQA